MTAALPQRTSPMAQLLCVLWRMLAALPELQDLSCAWSSCTADILPRMPILLPPHHQPPRLHASPTLSNAKLVSLLAAISHQHRVSSRVPTAGLCRCACAVIRLHWGVPAIAPVLLLLLLPEADGGTAAATGARGGGGGAAGQGPRE